VGEVTSPPARPPAVDLDHAATTPMRPEAVAAMEPFASERYGNPSGAHRLARDAVRAVDEARERIAASLGCGPGEVVFTSGGTEADNHAVCGGMPPRPGVPVCSAVEHHAVLDPVTALGGRTVEVDRCGRVDLERLAEVLDELGTSTSVVSVMLANNETGVVNDLDAVAAVVRAHESEVPWVPLHTDAVQAAAWLDLGVAAAAADLVSVSAHKLGGPKGVGALVVRRHAQLRPMLLGGGQERGRRSGTLNVAGIVGFAAALDATVAAREEANGQVAKLRDRLAAGLRATVPGLVETVSDACSGGLLPGILHVCIEGVDSESLLFLLESDGVLASAASSCASGAQESSHVLAAMGVPESVAGGSLRLSLGWDSTEDDVDVALRAVPAAVQRVREFG
jgi:cysteine desulfurase